MKAVRLLAPLILLVLANATMAQDDPKPGPDPKAEKFSKLPWDKAALFEAMPWGMSYKFDYEEGEKHKSGLRFDIYLPDKDEVSVAQTTISSKGVEKPGKSRRLKWEGHLDDLVDNFKTPTVTEEELALGEKKYACKVFSELTDGDGCKAWFCKDVPGIWLKYEFHRAGKLKSKYTLTSMDTYHVAMPWKLGEVAPSMKDGARFKYKLTTNSGAYYLEIEYSNVGETNYTEKQTKTELDGKALGEPASAEVNWNRHFRNFLFVKPGPKVADAEVAVGEQKLECLAVTTEEAGGESTRTRTLYISKKHPGMIAGLVSETKSADKSFKTLWELVEFKIGK